ncbi:hypothetical protein GCM10012275_05360 [Longimycelium tulufanense]|uniref:Uncharacterized protein n=1 Tax=Longimycelium tulufanense TaxID=907463 RepID=A0A8J3FTU2_9PSEU|nr:hypothetical protein [Longimycelium tulufanense]GGM37137.1 hypothetical protein GCM10012275_05360 [Longimycelium tulufanense]
MSETQEIGPPVSDPPRWVLPAKAAGLVAALFVGMGVGVVWFTEPGDQPVPAGDNLPPAAESTTTEPVAPAGKNHYDQPAPADTSDDRAPGEPDAGSGDDEATTRHPEPTTSGVSDSPSPSAWPTKSTPQPTKEPKPKPPLCDPGAPTCDVSSSH